MTTLYQSIKKVQIGRGGPHPRRGAGAFRAAHHPWGAPGWCADRCLGFASSGAAGDSGAALWRFFRGGLRPVPCAGGRDSASVQRELRGFAGGGHVGPLLPALPYRS